MKQVYKYLIVAIVASIITLLIRSWLVKPVPPEIIERKVTVYRDTSKVLNPISSFAIRLPNYKFFSFPADTLREYLTNIVVDSIPIPVPITQKVYEDSTYTAYVSGFEPSLDSLFIYNKTVVVDNILYPPKYSFAPFVDFELSTVFWEARAGVMFKMPLANKINFEVAGGYSFLHRDLMYKSPFLETKLTFNIFNW